jgi:hypothetical protein
MAGEGSQIFPLPLPKNGTQISELVSEGVSEKSPQGSSGRENSANSLSISSIELSQTKQQEPDEPSSEENTRLWLYKIWKTKTREDLNVRKTDLLRLERFIEKHGEQKAARAWFAYVNADPCPYNLSAIEIAVKRKWKNGQEWLEGAEDESKITHFPLAAFFAVTPGYLVAADELLVNYHEQSFLKSYGKSIDEAHTSARMAA